LLVLVKDPIGNVPLFVLLAIPLLAGQQPEQNKFAQ